jgi:chromatin remodeling complex protein RSC6
MSSNITGTSTMSSAAPKASKKVAKKDAAPEAAPAPVAAPVKEVKAKKEKAAPAPAPVAAPAPEASAVEAAPAGPTTTLQQDIDALVAQFQSVRDTAVAGIKALQKLNKRVARDLKEAGRRRRRQRKTEGSEGEASKRPTIFKTPVTLKKELASFLGHADGTKMTPADVTKAFSAYVEAHKLKNAEKGQGHTIHPDAAMRKLFGLKDGETVSYRNVQAHLYKLYILPEKKAVA